jgi:predicted small integral membrane protein
MGTRTTDAAADPDASDSGSPAESPTRSLGYVAILAAIVTAAIHLLLGANVLGFNRLLGVLFLLNGLGFLGGTVLYLTRYWRRELYLVAAGYAVVTILAFFAFQGLSADAFYMRGSLNSMAVVAKAVELVLAAVAIALYAGTTE